MSTTPVTYSTSAALLFTEQELGGPCVEVESYYTITSASQNVIAQGNGDRVGLLIMNLGSNSLYVGLNGIISSTTGIALLGSGASISLTVRDDFTLPSRQWSATSVGGSSFIYVLEIIRYTSLAQG
jgi:hypothetical protein